MYSYYETILSTLIEAGTLTMLNLTKTSKVCLNLSKNIPNSPQIMTQVLIKARSQLSFNL